MSLTGAIILLAVGILLWLLFAGALHIIGIVCAVIGLAVLIAAVASSSMSMRH